jgi:hypothetical protein
VLSAIGSFGGLFRLEPGAGGPQLLRLPLQLHEHPHLRAQDLRHHQPQRAHPDPHRQQPLASMGLHFLTHRV